MYITIALDMLKQTTLVFWPRYKRWYFGLDITAGIGVGISHGISPAISAGISVGNAKNLKTPSRIWLAFLRDIY